MNDFNVVSVPYFRDFVEQIGSTKTVRLVLTERYDPDRCGVGSDAFSVPAKSVTLDLQALSKDGDLIWLSQSQKVTWGTDGPATQSDKQIHMCMLEQHDIVKQHLERHGYTVLPGRWVLPRDLVPIGGVFDCARWEKTEDGLHVRLNEEVYGEG